MYDMYGMYDMYDMYEAPPSKVGELPGSKAVHSVTKSYRVSYRCVRMCPLRRSKSHHSDQVRPSNAVTPSSHRELVSRSLWFRQSFNGLSKLMIALTITVLWLWGGHITASSNQIASPKDSLQRSAWLTGWLNLGTCWHSAMNYSLNKHPWKLNQPKQSTPSSKPNIKWKLAQNNPQNPPHEKHQRINSKHQTLNPSIRT